MYFINDLKIQINMSTNFYLKDKNGDVNIHICKVMNKNDVCFDINNGMYWEPTRKSLEGWLSNPNREIVDEYGDTYTPKEFWKMVDDYNREYKKTHIFIKHADDDEEDFSLIYQTNVIKEQYKNYNIEIIGCDFYVDGLKFFIYSFFV